MYFQKLLENLKQHFLRGQRSSVRRHLKTTILDEAIQYIE